MLSNTDINHFGWGKPHPMSNVCCALPEVFKFIHILLGSKVLLDEYEDVKLAGFGLSKIIQVQFYDILDPFN